MPPDNPIPNNSPSPNTPKIPGNYPGIIRRGAAATRKLTTLKRPRAQPTTQGALPPSVKNKIRAFSAMMDNTQLEITEPTKQNKRPSANLPLARHTPRIRLPIKPILIVVALVVLVAGFRSVTAFRLVTYQHEDFTVSAPKDYVADESGPLISLKPKKSAKDYQVVILLPEQQGLNFDLSQASEYTKQALLELVETTLERTAGQYVPQGQQLGETTVTLTKHQDKDAVKLNGELKTNGKKSGQIAGMSVFDEQGIYTVMVVTSTENANVEKNTNNLINSFTLR